MSDKGSSGESDTCAAVRCAVFEDLVRPLAPWVWVLFAGLRSSVVDCL